MSRFIDPDRMQFEAFKGLDRETELNMLNLVRRIIPVITFWPVTDGPARRPMPHMGATLRRYWRGWAATLSGVGRSNRP